jgi:hypothetical protein
MCDVWSPHLPANDVILSLVIAPHSVCCPNTGPVVRAAADGPRRPRRPRRLDAPCGRPGSLLGPQRGRCARVCDWVCVGHFGLECHREGAAAGHTHHPTNATCLLLLPPSQPPRRSRRCRAARPSRRGCSTPCGARWTRGSTAAAQTSSCDETLGLGECSRHHPAWSHGNEHLSQYQTSCRSVLPLPQPLFSGSSGHHSSLSTHHTQPHAAPHNVFMRLCAAPGSTPRLRGRQAVPRSRPCSLSRPRCCPPKGDTAPIRDVPHAMDEGAAERPAERSAKAAAAPSSAAPVCPPGSSKPAEAPNTSSSPDVSTAPGAATCTSSSSTTPAPVSGAGPSGADEPESTSSSGGSDDAEVRGGAVVRHTQELSPHPSRSSSWVGCQ